MSLLQIYFCIPDRDLYREDLWDEYEYNNGECNSEDGRLDNIVDYDSVDEELDPFAEEREPSEEFDLIGSPPDGVDLLSENEDDDLMDEAFNMLSDREKKEILTLTESDTEVEESSSDDDIDDYMLSNMYA